MKFCSHLLGARITLYANNAFFSGSFTQSESYLERKWLYLIETKENKRLPPTHTHLTFHPFYLWSSPCLPLQSNFEYFGVFRWRIMASPSWECKPEIGHRRSCLQQMQSISGLMFLSSSPGKICNKRSLQLYMNRTVHKSSLSWKIFCQHSCQNFLQTERETPF